MSDLDGLARELELRAGKVEAIGDQLVRAAAIAIWTSVAADAFRAQVSRRRRDCADVAATLRCAAATVRHFTRDVDAEKARLRRLEEAALRRAEGGVRAIAHGVQETAHGIETAVHGAERLASRMGAW